MQYFRNFELANMFNVSQAAVGKWIVSAQSGKLELDLIEQENKVYIANTAKNLAVIEDMVRERKKYFNKRSLKVTTPSPDFYDLYSREQAFDIISNLDIHREIPLKYTFFAEGADYWEKYTDRLLSEDTPNLLKSTIELLRTNQAYLDSLICKYKRVNLIDVGEGNGYPAKELVAYLLDKGVFGRYVAIDVSPDMLERRRRNMQQWFGDKVEFEGHIRDINYQRFADVLMPETFGTNGDEVINLVLFFGGVLSNFRSPADVLRVFYNSMGKNDLLLYTDILDTSATRLHFDYNIVPGAPLLPTHQMIDRLLNIDQSYYEIERQFDEKEKFRFMRVRLKVALSIKFTFDDGERLLHIPKGAAILRWRHLHFSAMDIMQLFNDCGFTMLQAISSADRNYILTISHIKAQGNDQ